MLRFTHGERIIDMGARTLAGRDIYRIDRRLPELANEDAVAEHMLSIVFPDTTVKSTTIRKGEVLNADLPWLFDDLDGTSARFVRQGAGVVASPQGLVCVPAEWKIEFQPDSHVRSTRNRSCAF